jgi:hypothetical protein
MPKKLLIIILALFLLQATGFAQEPAVSIEPEHYICYRTTAPPEIDGKINDAEWQKVEWSANFRDIEGPLKPEPRYRTRMKMLWDNQFLYIAAELVDPHVWATLKERESVVFLDNDFEVFIDPDGDTHHYLEYEMNALNTQWDLMLLKPYRDDLRQNVAIDHWNFNGIRSAVFIDGTLNNPSDTDRGWTVEIAIPMDAISEVSATGNLPVNGEQYRMNFSRVEWTVDIAGGQYAKRKQLVNGKEVPLPENNWVWSPQGVIAMHQPETWGYVQFSEQNAGAGHDTFLPDPDRDVRAVLRRLYFSEYNYHKGRGVYTSDLKSLGVEEIQMNGQRYRPEISLTASLYEATLPSADGTWIWHIVQDGRIWKTKR